MSFIMFLFFGFVAVFGISNYLAPDDLKDCAATPTDTGNCIKVDAIVVVSGGDTTARTDGAIELYNNHWANRIVMSGAAADKSGPSNAEAMRLQAIDAGVPESSIILDETSETTKENANNSVDIFKQHDIGSAILVTSGYHQRRADLEFSKRAGDSVNIINHPIKTDNQWGPWWWTTPNGWYLASSEIVKIILFYAGVSR